MVELPVAKDSLNQRTNNAPTHYGMTKGDVNAPHENIGALSDLFQEAEKDKVKGSTEERGWTIEHKPRAGGPAMVNNIVVPVEDWYEDFQSRLEDPQK